MEMNDSHSDGVDAHYDEADAQYGHDDFHDNGEVWAPSLKDVPVEDVIFKSIFTKLDLKALFNLANTCTIYREMVSNYFRTMKVIDVGGYGAKISERALNVLLSESRQCQKLVLRHCKSTLNDKILVPITEKSPQLVHADFTYCTCLSNASLQALAVNCTQLTHLSLNGCVWASPEAVTNLGIHCKELQKLDLTGCWNINDECVSTITVTCPRLSDLNLSKIYGITDNSVKSVARNSNSIKRLNVAECWRITDESLWLLLEYSKHLKALQVKGCRSITPNILASFRRKGVMTDCFTLKPSIHSRNTPPVQI